MGEVREYDRDDLRNGHRADGTLYADIPPMSHDDHDRLDNLVQLVQTLRDQIRQPRRSAFRGMVDTELDLRTIAGPLVGDMAVTADTRRIYLYETVGWVATTSLTALAPPVAGAPPPSQNAVTTVPTEVALLASTGTGSEVKVAADTGRFFRWIVGTGWTEIAPDLSVVQTLIAQMQLRLPAITAADLGRALVVDSGTTAAWTDLPSPTVTASNAAGASPAGMVGMSEGDVMVNLADRKAWTYEGAGSGWVLLVDPVEVTTGIAASDAPPVNADTGDAFINKATGETWVRAATTWERTSAPAAAQAGLVLTSRAGAPPQWAPAAASAILGGVVTVAPASEPHEYTWTTLALPTTLSTLRNGEYFIVEDPATTIPAAMPGIGGQAVEPGDWVIAVDSDSDGAVDTFHLVKRPADIPPNVTSSAVAGTAPPATGAKRGDEFVNTADRRNWVYDGTSWVERVHPPPGVTVSGAAGATPPATGAGRGDEFVNTADNRHWVYDGATWVERTEIPPTTGVGVGDVLAITTTGVAWESPAKASTLAGVIAAVHVEAHEYTWTELANNVFNFTPGQYLIVDHVPADGRVPGLVPSIGGSPVKVGDWVVSISSQKNAVADNFHLVSHDRPFTARHALSYQKWSMPVKMSGGAYVEWDVTTPFTKKADSETVLRVTGALSMYTGAGGNEKVHIIYNTDGIQPSPGYAESVRSFVSAADQWHQIPISFTLTAPAGSHNLHLWVMCSTGDLRTGADGVHNIEIDEIRAS